MPYRGGLIEIEFDFLGHTLLARSSRGEERALRLENKSVADFYHEYRAMLKALGADVRIMPVPNEVADATPFDAAGARSFGRIAFSSRSAADLPESVVRHTSGGVDSTWRVPVSRAGPAPSIRIRFRTARLM